MTDDIESLRRLSKIQDLVDLNEFMQDEHLAMAMEYALKIIAKPDMPLASARIALATFQALALKLKAQGQVYMTIKKGKTGSDENNKKNVYLSMSIECHEMAQTLKYLCKELYL